MAASKVGRVLVQTNPSDAATRSEPLTAKDLFDDTPQGLRKLVLFLYAVVGPVFVLVLDLERDPARGAWQLPAVAALIAAGGLFAVARPKPRAADWIFPIAIVPTVCCGIGAVACGERGEIYVAVTAAPMIWAAALCEGSVALVAWGVACATCFGVFYMLQNATVAALGTVLFATILGLVAWTVRGKAQALRLLHAGTEERAARHEALHLELAKAKQQLDRALAGSREGTWSIDLRTGLVMHDSRYEQMLGYPSGGLQRSMDTWGELIHPDDREPAQVALHDHLEGRSPDYDVECRMKNGAGEWLWVRARGRVSERDEGGRPLRVAGTSTDVDGEHRARWRQLRDARLTGLEERINEIELVMTLDGRIVVANDRAVEAYGHSREELLRRNIRELRAGPSRLEVDSQLASVAEKGAVRFEAEHVRRDGTAFPVQVSSRKFEVEGEAFLHSLIRDLTTERRSHERDLQAQRMDSLGALAGGMAHDFNNLLTVIRSYTEIVIADLPAGDPRRDDLSEVATAASRAAAFTQRLLAISRSQARAPCPAHLGEIVLGLRPAMAAILGPLVHLEVEPVPPDLWSASLDREQIEQVLSNLVSNARGAMPRGGTLRIATSNVTDPVDGEVFGEAPPPGEYVLLSVADTGIGIDAAMARRLFEPVMTTRDGTRTTGLGLTVVYGIVRQSNGHVALSSLPGRGSTFRIYFPRTKEAGPAASIAPPSLAGPTHAAREILLVDDDDDVRVVSRRLLERNGHEVLDASNGEEALALFKAHRETIGVILTDVVMPRMSGPDFVAHLDQAGVPRPPVIFMSAYTDSRSAGIAELPPQATFIAKPFDKAALLAMIASALASPPEAGAGASAAA